MQTIPTTVPELGYIPFLIAIILIVHYRAKFQIIDLAIRSLPSKASTAQRKWFILIVSTLYLIIFSTILAYLILPFSDVEEAMTAGIKEFWSGTNPFINEVVPHIILTSSGEEIIYGTYNYGPIDLLIYSIGYYLFSWLLGDNWWIVGFNYILLIIIYLILRQTYPDVPDTIKYPPFMVLMAFFLQDNAVLMCFFLALAWWCYIHLKEPYKHPAVVVMLTLGVLTKLYIVIVLLGYFFYVFQKNYRQWIGYTLLGGITGLLVMLPFNIEAVIRSVFFFHSNITEREQYATIQGGLPVLLELLGLNILYIPLVIGLTGIFIGLAWYYAEQQKGCNEEYCILIVKFIILTLLTISLLPSSVFAFFIIPTYFFLCLYNNNYHLGNPELIDIGK
ncbi:MAG: hypothetical protein ACXAC7_08070 [Candidatus Hodarchaeales archaeon]|jgi:hypothetical protein